MKAIMSQQLLSSSFKRNWLENSKFGTFKYMKHDCSQSFFHLADRDQGRLWVSVADRLTSGLSTKEDVPFKHLSPACIIKHCRDSVLCSESPQPTSNINLLVDIKTAHQNRSSVVPDFIDSRKESNFNISSGDFQKQPKSLIHSFKLLFQYHEHVSQIKSLDLCGTQVKSNNRYGEK